MRMKLMMTVVMLAGAAYGYACTNLIVGKKASADGSVFVSYSADDFGSFGYLRHYPAGKHAKGSTRSVYDWETNAYLGEIEEAEETYNVIGNMNEYQLTITETTFGGRSELENPEGKLDYGSLIYITLQRAKTAREAIGVLTGLIDRYGYKSEGESFTFADKEEAWVMDLIGKGPGRKGAVWVAMRVPDDCICAHANHSRIRRFPLKDKANCLYAKDVISFAAKKDTLRERKTANSPSATHTLRPISVPCVSARRAYGASSTSIPTGWTVIFPMRRVSVPMPSRCLCLSNPNAFFPHRM